MANVKISDLTAAGSVVGTQQFEVNDSGTSKRVTAAQIAAYAATTITPGSIGAVDTDDIGVTVQAYDVDTAKLDVDQSWTGSQRGAITTDNDLSFDMAAANNFYCTPTGTGTLTFTNIAAGQSGYIYLVNGSAYAISKAASVKAGATLLTTISATGNYVISYYAPDASTVVLTSSQAVS